MSKHHSPVELLSSNNKNGHQDKFQMKTKIYPHLPHLQSTKTIMKYSIKFLNIPGGYVIAISKFNKLVNSRYEDICKDLY